jgi:GalNAc-alpha-(1->4)-GalNAc-alpha-(1->3)-diNAcBac-PP-undecaprenol alpha-1,4-N-acetyl-D-galactosaminyltransferase
LVNAWSQRGDSVTLVPTFSGRGESFYPVSDAVCVIYLADLVNIRRKTIFGQLARLYALRRLINETRPDVVVSFLANVNVAAILATRWTKVPVIVCERTNPVVETKSGRFLKLSRRLTYPLAEMVTVQAEDTLAPFRVFMPKLKELAVIPNPLPQGIETFTPVPGILRQRSRLLAMGRLSAEKQFDMLINVYAHLAERFSAWDLWIWGEGDMRAILEHQVGTLDLTGRVFLPGVTQRPWFEMSQSDVFVLSSAFEGFPNVLLEAMALGIPCVSFDCPSGPRELTRGGDDALLVPAGDMVALQAALARMMEDQELRTVLGTKAATSIRSRYSLTNVIGRWDNLFSKVCK